MPRISAFFGLVIFMPTSDHEPPHFHVSEAERRGRIMIATGEAMPGSTLSPRARRLLERWRRLHIDELVQAWADIRAGRVPGTIEPLR